MAGYEYACLHCTECSAVFDQKQPDPCAPPLCSPVLALSNFFPQTKKVLQGTFCQCEEVKQTKMVEALKGIKIDEFKNCFE